MSFRDISEQQFDSDEQLLHRLFKANCRVLRRFAYRLQQVRMGLPNKYINDSRVTTFSGSSFVNDTSWESRRHNCYRLITDLWILQLDGFDATKVIQITWPFIIAACVREHWFWHQFVSLEWEYVQCDRCLNCNLLLSYLIIEVVVKIIPQKAVDDNSLALKVLAQSAGAKTAVQEAANSIQAASQFIGPWVVEVAACGQQIQSPPVLPCYFLHKLVRTHDTFLDPSIVNAVKQDKHVDVNINLKSNAEW